MQGLGGPTPALPKGGGRNTRLHRLGNKGGRLSRELFSSCASAMMRRWNGQGQTRELFNFQSFNRISFKGKTYRGTEVKASLRSLLELRKTDDEDKT